MPISIRSEGLVFRAFATSGAKSKNEKKASRTIGWRRKSGVITFPNTGNGRKCYCFSLSQKSSYICRMKFIPIAFIVVLIIGACSSPSSPEKNNPQDTTHHTDTTHHNDTTHVDTSHVDTTHHGIDTVRPGLSAFAVRVEMIPPLGIDSIASFSVWVDSIDGFGRKAWRKHQEGDSVICNGVGFYYAESFRPGDTLFYYDMPEVVESGNYHLVVRISGIESTFDLPVKAFHITSPTLGSIVRLTQHKDNIVTYTAANAATIWAYYHYTDRSPDARQEGDTPDNGSYVMDMPIVGKGFLQLEREFNASLTRAQGSTPFYSLDYDYWTRSAPLNLDFR